MLPYDCGIKPQGEKGDWDIIVFAELKMQTQNYPYKYARYGHNIPELHNRQLEQFEKDFIKQAVARDKWIIEGSMHGLYLRQEIDIPMHHQFNSISTVRLQLCCHVPKSMTTYFTLKQEDKKTVPLLSDDPLFRGLSYQKLGRLLSQHTRMEASRVAAGTPKKEMNVMASGRNVGKSMWARYGMQVLHNVKGILNIDTTA